MPRQRIDAPGTAYAESGAIVITAPRLAEYLGVSPRRVWQMRQRGELVTHGRGLIDASHAFNARIGRLFLTPEKAARLDKFRIAAVGWLMVRWSAGVTARPGRLARHGRALAAYPRRGAQGPRGRRRSDGAPASELQASPVPPLKPDQAPSRWWV